VSACPIPCPTFLPELATCFTRRHKVSLGDKFGVYAVDGEGNLATGYPVTEIMTGSDIGDAMKNRGLKVYVIAALVQSLLVVKEQGDRHFPHKACICALYPYDATVCFFLKRVTDRYLLFFFTAVPVTPHMEEVTNLLNTPASTSILPLTNNGGETLHLWAFSPETSRIWQQKLGVTHRSESDEHPNPARARAIRNYIPASKTGYTGP